jgi:hypothetical protein
VFGKDIVPNRITELHSIMPIDNISSVMRYGILSHEKAKTIKHSDVSLAEVQDRRTKKEVPNGLKLHQYANLYFHARNPMMYKRQAQAGNLCILRISNQIIKLKGVVFTDQNAASDYARFLIPSEYKKINFDWVYADDWRDPDQITQWRKSSAKCAEVLVPNSVQPHFIDGAYVVNRGAESNLQQVGYEGPITINSDLFFR